MLCLLNNDTEVLPNFLDSVVSYLESEENIGMLSPKITYFKYKDLIWYAGAKINPKSPLFSWHIGFTQKDKPRFNKVRETDYANGAALFIPKNVVQKIGLLDEIFFLYVEETDWNLRVRKFGYKIIYYPKTTVYHKIDPLNSENRFGYRNNPFQIYLYSRNRIILVFKHFSLLNILLFFMLNQFKSLLFEFYFSIRNRKFTFLVSLFRAILFGIIIGVRRRTNRTCESLIKKEYLYIQRFDKYRK
ncbi:MAG: hypothetical protein GF311_13195 [Candidatus Lokiarchaeota archaeon]|nr:hypothetical protein [Candidatus Lokiarchaeota archaeon]